MDDLTICKKIAEIEGHYLSEEWDCLGDGGVLIGHGHGNLSRYNPLTDDALCFQLMVKNSIALLPCCDKWECQIYSIATIELLRIYNESPNKAICLAIIEAHKDG